MLSEYYGNVTKLDLTEHITLNTKAKKLHKLTCKKDCSPRFVFFLKKILFIEGTVRITNGEALAIAIVKLMGTDKTAVTGLKGFTG